LWGAGVVICLERGAALHMAQLMALPLTVSCFSKIQVRFTFPAHPGSAGIRAIKWVCVCVCVRACVRACVCEFLATPLDVARAEKKRSFVRRHSSRGKRTRQSSGPESPRLDRHPSLRFGPADAAAQATRLQFQLPVAESNRLPPIIAVFSRLPPSSADCP